MNDLKKRRIATVGGDGVIRLEEQDLPAVGEGTVLENVEKEVERILGEPDRIPGVVFRCR